MAETQSKKLIQVDEKVPLGPGVLLSFQHLFAMFSASVLVPYLFNQAAGREVLSPSLALLMNGIGTLIFFFLGKRRAPAFLGSSFAFISPTCAIIASAISPERGFAMALGGFVVSGLLLCIVALIIQRVGTRWLDVVLPPAAMGPIVAIIGLELAGTAAKMAGIIPTTVTQDLIDKTGDTSLVIGGLYYDKTAVIISIFTLAIVVFGSLLFRRFFSVIPVLIAVFAGYVLSLLLGYVDYTPITTASWLTIPSFTFPVFNVNAILIIVPATLVVLAEHIGHVVVTSNIVGRDLTKDPGLHRTMLGDGISTMLSGFCGSCPTTTYGENMGVMAVTRVYSAYVIAGAGLISIILAFFGKISGFISSIPAPVMGGISLLLFGMIASSGIRMIVDAKVDYSKSKNLVLSSVIFIVGLSGATITIGTISLTGMALASVVGVVLGLIFYVLDRFHLINE